MGNSVTKASYLIDQIASVAVYGIITNTTAQVFLSSSTIEAFWFRSCQLVGGLLLLITAVWQTAGRLEKDRHHQLIRKAEFIGGGTIVDDEARVRLVLEQWVFPEIKRNPRITPTSTAEFEGLANELLLAYYALGTKQTSVPSLTNGIPIDEKIATTDQNSPRAGNAIPAEMAAPAPPSAPPTDPFSEHDGKDEASPLVVVKGMNQQTDQNESLLLLTQVNESLLCAGQDLVEKKG